MRILFIGALLSLFAGAVQAQEAGLQPKYDISPSIVKLPEQSDFYGTWLRSNGRYMCTSGAPAKVFFVGEDEQSLSDD